MGFGFRSKFGHRAEETISGLERMFTNTPIYDYRFLVYSFFSMELSSWEKEIYRDFRSDVSKYIEEALQLALLLRELKRGKVKGKGWIIESESDIVRIYGAVEPLFLDKIDALPDVLHSYKWDEYTDLVLPEWEQALANFPCSKEVELEDKGGEEDTRHLSIEEIDKAIASIKRCKKAAKNFFHESDEAVAKRFVGYMIENGVPESRKMYCCWYDALDCFWGIPEEIKKSHNYSQEDPRSNYIKAIASRYHKKKAMIDEDGTEVGEIEHGESS